MVRTVESAGVKVRGVTFVGNLLKMQLSIWFTRCSILGLPEFVEVTTRRKLSCGFPC